MFFATVLFGHRSYVDGDNLDGQQGDGETMEVTITSAQGIVNNLYGVAYAMLYDDRRMVVR